jgi:hypothetical protein
MLDAMSDRCCGGLRFRYARRLYLMARVAIASRQNRREKDDADCDAAGREHPGAAPGTRYPLAPFVDQRLDSLFALLLEIVGVAFAQRDCFLRKGCEWLDGRRVLVVFHGFQGRGELRSFGPG